MKDESSFPNSDVKGALRKAWTMSKSYLNFKKSKKITRERLTAKGVPSKIPSVFYKCDDVAFFFVLLDMFTFLCRLQ